MELPVQPLIWRWSCSTTGEGERAERCCDRGEAYIRKILRLATAATALPTLQILALRGETAEALAKLARGRAGRMARPWWRYYRDLDPDLASIRNEPEFKAVFADIERDMAQQRARLAARPKDAPLELAEAST